MLSRAPAHLQALDLAELFAPMAARSAVGLSVSGGADSLALMVLAHQWAQGQDQPPKLIVYTLNHGLRPEAGAETGFVARCAQELGLAVRVLNWDGPKPKSGVQAAARQARYRLIGAAMLADGAEILLTAHHRGDQAETLLMRMAHGSGLAGLGGIHAEALVEGVPVFRPFLEMDKSQLETIVKQCGWQAVADPSNDDLHYERVRWRQKLPDFIELGLSPDTLAGLAKRLRRAERALRAATTQAFDAMGSVDRFGVVRLDAAGFGAAQDEIQVRLLQSALYLAGDRQKPFALAQVEQLSKDLTPPEFAPVTLFGCKVSRNQDQIVFAREAGRLSDGCVEIPPHGQIVWDGRFEIGNTGAASVCVGPAKNFSKKRIAEVLTHDNFLMADMGGTPIVCTQQGRVLAIGTQVFDNSITCIFEAADGLRAQIQA